MCPSSGQNSSSPGTMGYGWIWSAAVFGAEFGVSPVIVRPLSLTDWGEIKARDLRSRVCPGTPLTMFANWEDLPPTRTEIEIDGIRLADYQLNDAPGGDMGGFGIIVP